MPNGSFNAQDLNKRFKHFNAELAEAIAYNTFNKTVSDFGAGLGLYVQYLRATGFAIGYDGTLNIAEVTDGVVQTVDLSQRCRLMKTQVVMSIEVGEHIPPEHHDNFVFNLCEHATELIILSWATRDPFQRGRGHINCRNPEELIPDFSRRGWFVDVFMTEIFRGTISAPFNEKVLLFTKQPKEGYHDANVIDYFRICR